MLAPKIFKSIYGSAAVQAALKEAKLEDSVSEEMLAGLKVPTMLVWGKSEKLLPYESVEYFRKHLPPGAEVHEVEGFGHVPQMEKPKQLLELLLGFARRQKLIT
jgi:pimeloyl-ACP methyl ester carboxylesterase